MQVFVVIRINPQPNYNRYDSGGIDKYRSVEFVTADEEVANKFCLANKPASVWHDSFEIEKSVMK